MVSDSMATAAAHSASPPAIHARKRRIIWLRWRAASYVVSFGLERALRIRYSSISVIGAVSSKVSTVSVTTGQLESKRANCHSIRRETKP